MTTSATTPRIYVGTYSKYNNGSIAGAWLDLSDYSTKEDFLAACAELHKDEQDPELMFQDFEGFPKRYYSECSVSDELFEYVQAVQDMDADTAEALEEFVNGGYELSDFEEAYCGKWDTEVAFADNLAEELGYYAAMEKAGLSSHYFDYEAFARDLFCGDYWRTSNGHVFRSI